MAYDDGLFGNEGEVVKTKGLNLVGRDCGKFYPKEKDVNINEYIDILNESKECEQSKYDDIIDRFIKKVEFYRIYVWEPYIYVIIANEYPKEFMDRLSEKMYDTRHEGTESHKMGILTIYHNNYEYPGIYWSPQEDGHHTEFVDGKYELIKTVYPKRTWKEVNEEIRMREKGYINGVKYTLADFNKVI